MGLLALDVSAHGIVMSADSQPVEIRDGETRVLTGGTPRTRNPILIRDGGGFRGLVGFVGTEDIGGTSTRDWLLRFGSNHANDDLATYATELGSALTDEWKRLGLTSVLETLVSGVVNADVRFWYVRNSDGLHDQDLTYRPPKAVFDVVDDLDANYVARDIQPGQTKEQLLQSRIYSFRQGALHPAALVFDAFSRVIATIYASGIDGFEPFSSLDDLGYFARQRMEFMKRLYSADHGIYKNPSAPLDGNVHVLGVALDGEIRQYPKLRQQVKVVHTA
jgi:hypothetical protein